MGILKSEGKRMSIDRRILGIIAIIFGLVIFLRPDVLGLLVGAYLILIGILEVIR